MEKINTPLGELIELERDMLRMANNAIDLASYEEEKEFFRSEKIKHLYTISMLKQALPKERDMIEKAHNDSIVEFIEALGMEAETDPQRAKDYFTQTFKSYE